MGAFKSFLSEHREMRRFQKLERAERNIVFYSESEFYWSYLEPFVSRLINDHGKTVCYLTSSPSDPLLKSTAKGIRPFYIGDGTIRTILFAGLDADVMVMTIPDLDNYSLKRSKHPVHYVYVPHNLTSTHMVFRKGAFDAFDTILCAGPHHVAEAHEAESLYGLPPRSLIEVGYVKLDAIRETLRSEAPPPATKTIRVLITPSWPPHNLLEIVGIDLIEALLSEGYEVVVRPHRDTKRLAGKSLADLQDRFQERPNFALADGSAGRIAFNEADVLITDWSGSAISFAFSRERPVLSIDIPRKVLNPEYVRFSNEPLEVTIRDKIGAILQPDHIADAPRLVAALHDRREEFAHSIQKERNRWVFNIDNSAAVGASHLAKLAEGGQSLE